VAGWKRALGACAVLALFVAARGPLHLRTHALPLSNDDAIPLLMARHIARGELATTLWNQPYNGALDSYLLAPWVALAPAHAVFRSYELACALALVALIGLVAARLAGARAGWLAAGLAAVGNPYMALMAAAGPVPNFLLPLVTGLPLLFALHRAEAAGPRPLGRGLALGVLAGLGVWTSSLAVPALAGMAVGLLLAGQRPGRAFAWFSLGLAGGASPLLLARLIGASGSDVVTAASAVTAIRPPWLWTSGLADLARAAAGLLGLEVPLVVDGPERAALPRALSAMLGAGLLAVVAVGSARRKAWPLLGWAGALCAAFALSRRTSGDELRYLYGVVPPVLVLAGAGLARLGAAGRVVAGLAILGPWAAGHVLLARAWSDPTHADRVWQVPRLEPVLDTLGRAGVRSAYASLQLAGRLTLESEERLIASQAWNERIPGDPLRFRDEVDLDPQAAWVLSARLSRGMPRPAAFRDVLASLGGSWKEDLPGDFTVFRRFVPPYDEARPVPASDLAVAVEGGPLPKAVLDRDPDTRWTSPTGLFRGFRLGVRLARPRRVDALVLAVDLERSPVAVPWIAEVDGATVAQGPARHGLQWVSGAPRAGQQALLAIVLGGRPAREVAVVFQGPGPPLVLGEVFVYGPDEEPKPASGAAAAEAALEQARRANWPAAVAAYAEAVRLEPHRASHHANLARARHRAAGRRWLDVESLDDGGPALVQAGR
jgi:hypothetical protein